MYIHAQWMALYIWTLLSIIFYYVKNFSDNCCMWLLIFLGCQSYAFYVSRYEALRVAFIDEVETVKDGKPHTEYYSRLVKADIHGKDKVIFGAFSFCFIATLLSFGKFCTLTINKPICLFKLPCLFH